MSEGRLPTGLWMEIHLKNLTARAVPFYFVQKGNEASGLVLLKLNGMKGAVKLLTQQRDFEDNKLIWVNALDEETVEEAQADAYIQRAVDRDPDLWALEIEDENMNNPFEDDAA
ncbi:MAG: DUF1491 family protein [Pseudomonadota bacterium]